MKTITFLALLSLWFCNGSAQFSDSSEETLTSDSRELTSLKQIFNSVFKDNRRRSGPSTAPTKEEAPVEAPSESEAPLEEERKPKRGKVDECPGPSLIADTYYSLSASIVATFETVSVAECQEECRKRKNQCVSIVYDQKYKSCFILSGLGQAIPSVNGIAVQVAFSGGEPCDTGNFVYRYYRPGVYTPYAPINTPLRCCIKCRNSPKGCRAWYYDASKLTCYIDPTSVYLLKSAPSAYITSGLGCASKESFLKWG